MIEIFMENLPKKSPDVLDPKSDLERLKQELPSPTDVELQNLKGSVESKKEKEDSFESSIGLDMSSVREIIDSLNREQIQDIYHMLTNQGDYETYVNKFVKYLSPGDDVELTWYQQILLAPANAIETSVTSLTSVVDPEFYKALENVDKLVPLGISFIYVFAEKLNPAEKTALLSQFVYGAVLSAAIVDKLVKFMKSLRLLRGRGRNAGTKIGRLANKVGNFAQQNEKGLKLAGYVGSTYSATSDATEVLNDLNS